MIDTTIADVPHHVSSSIERFVDCSRHELEELRQRVTGKAHVNLVGNTVRLSVSLPGSKYRKLVKGGRSLSRELQNLIRADLAIAAHIN
jgi:hypothetical protein